MNGFQRIVLVVPVVTAVALSCAPAAGARSAWTPVITPAAPTLKDPITVTWRAGTPKLGVSYGARIAIANRVGLACTTDTTAVRLRAIRNGRFTATFKPAKGLDGKSVWCPGQARVSIRRYGPGDLESPVLARRVFTIRVGAGETPPAESPAAASAAAGLRVSPSAPTRATPLTVTWRATADAPASARYRITVFAGPPSSAKLACSHVSSRSGLRRRAGGLVTATLRPTGTPVETRKWCTGASTAVVSRELGGTARVVTRTTFTIGRRKGELPPGPRNTPAAIRLLAGSTITVGAAGHADRSSPLNGVLRGFIPSPFRLNQDISITRAGGSLLPVALAADPLCPGTGPPPALRVTPASTVTLRASGHVTVNLTLAGSASQLIGCGPAAPLVARTTIPLTGQTGARGLLGLNLEGAANGIALRLLVLVDLFDRT